MHKDLNKLIKKKNLKTIKIFLIKCINKYKKRMLNHFLFQKIQINLKD